MVAMYDNLLAGVPLDLWINGTWRAAQDGLRFAVEDPATEATIATVASATPEDCLAAVEAAHAAQPVWEKTSPRDRSEILRKAYDLMMRDRERLARIITLENGKSLADARAEVAYAAEFFRWNAEEAVRITGQLSRAPASGARILVNQKPAGVALLITPWNFPAAMATRKIGPALAAGCTVVLKPASATPLTMLALMPILEAAGVPPGVVNVVPSERSGEVASAMLHDDRVRVVSFTGSTQVGRVLLKEAADNVVRPAMELGGNAPFIVFDDADLEAALDGAMIAKMRNMGEACTAANRFYVQAGISTAFAQGMAERMAALKVGNGLQDGVTVGPLVNRTARDKVASLVEDAVKKGAKVLLGGKRIKAKGNWFEPTVLTEVNHQMAVMREESFGPVIGIMPVRDDSEAVRLMNDTDYGLTAGVYTPDRARAERVLAQVKSGSVYWNCCDRVSPRLPWSGVGDSGVGLTLSTYGIETFTRPKAWHLRTP